MNDPVLPKLVPLLVVRDAVYAVEFYVRALRAREVARYMNERLGKVSHVDLAIGDAFFSITEENRAWNADAPPSLGGSPVVLQLRIDDVEASFETMREAGAAVVFPLVEFCGERMGRVRDPFGHLWILTQRIEPLSPDETRRRRGAWSLGADSSKTSATVAGSPARWQEPARDPHQARIYVVVGPVGAGKSTFALALSRQHRALRLDLDEWMTDLFRPDRPETARVEWYVERAARCVDHIWKLTTRAVESGTHVVLEVGLLRRLDREQLYRRVDAGGYELVVYIVDAPREVRRERVEKRNRDQGETFSMVVPAQVFEMASDMWEPPDETECRARDMKQVSSDA
jgi:predicted kinase/uncharacterized glyoxalase superfamily protein PhnB